jgi:hypothetical protein
MGSKRDLQTSSAVRRSSWGAQVGLVLKISGLGSGKMEEKEPTTKDPIEYLLESILRSKNRGGGNTNYVHAPVEISASPEEGVRLIRAFICIKQPELRAAIIKLTTQIADDRALTNRIQN